MDKTTNIVPSERRGETRVTGTPRGIRTPAKPPMEALRADIEKTRNETVRTINELERRLSPSNIKEQVKRRARQATLGRMSLMAKQTSEKTRHWGATVLETVKNNPLPALMAGGGLVWLITNGVRKNGDAYDWDYEVEEDEALMYDPIGPYETSGAEEFGATGQMKAGAQESLSRSRQKADQVRDKARHGASRARDEIRQRSRDLSQSATEYGRRVNRGGARARESFLQSIESNPLAMAGVFFMAGAVTGMAIPESRFEQEKLGPARERVIHRAREVGREQMEKVQVVVNEAKESAKEEAEKQGLVGRPQADRFEEKAQEKARGLKEKAEEKIKPPQI